MTHFYLCSTILYQKMKNRSRLEIKAMIIETIGDNGAIKAKIMYRVYLSFVQMKKYLSTLINKEMITYDEQAHIYKTTDKGRRFLMLYKQMTESVTMKQDLEND